MLILMKKGEMSRDNINGELDKLLTAGALSRQGDEEAPLFKGIGLAIDDAVVLGLAYKNDVEKQVRTTALLF